MGLQIKQTALFDDGDDLPAGYVRREGKVFEIGEYPDKNFTLTAEEADRAIAEFTPVQGDLEHRDTVLSGKVGTLQRIWRDGKALFGEALVPEWLDAILHTGDRQPTVSLEWDRRTKKLAGWGWVVDPRITDAALFAAFSNAQVQAEAEPTPAPVATKRGINMPLIDELRRRMAAFNNEGAANPNPAATPGVSEPSAAPTTTPAPTTTTTTTTPQTTTTTTPTPTPAANPADTGTPEPGPNAGGTGSVGFYAPGLQPEDDEARTVTFTAQRIIDTATATVDKLIAEGKLLSAGRQAALAAFTSAAFADEEHGPDVVTFTRHDNRVLDSRVAVLTEMFRDVPAHALFDAKLPVHVLHGNQNQTADQRIIEEARKQADAFNESMGVLTPAQAGTNGNGKH